MSSSGSSSNRQDLIQNAVLFLNDPKVRSSTLTSRITFLESKGLNEAEIQEALSQASSGSSSSGAGFEAGPSGSRSANGNYGPEYGYRYEVTPGPPSRDWRDMFIMAVVSGGVMYGLGTLARKYLFPHLQPPSTTSFQQTSQDLTTSYDEAAKLLTDLNEQTTKLSESIEADRQRVDGVIDSVEDALKSVRDSEERWRDEMREIRGEVDSVRQLVPRMLEKHSSNQSAALQDLQSELRSLKLLLQSRQALPQSNGTPTSQSPALGPSDGSSSSKTVNGKSSSMTESAANALLAPKAGRGIPAWQLPSSSSTSSVKADSPPKTGEKSAADGYNLDQSVSSISSLGNSEAIDEAREKAH